MHQLHGHSLFFNQIFVVWTLVETEVPCLELCHSLTIVLGQGASGRIQITIHKLRNSLCKLSPQTPP